MSFLLKLIVVFSLAFIESVVFFLPLTAAVLALLAIYEKNPAQGEVFGLSLLAGLFIDILQVRTLGTTSTLFLLIVFLIFLYQRKVTGKNPLFVGLAVFLSSLASSYLVMREFEVSLIQALVFAFLALIFLVFLKPSNLRQDEVGW